MRLLFCVLSSVVLFACGSTAPTCGPTTCDGCCTAAGMCVAGTATDACGTAGLNCDVCAGAQACVTQRCQVPAMDAGQDLDAGFPIIAPVETWTWADFPTSACGNGAATGLGVSISTRSTDLLIYLQGGGACWSALTCGFAATNIATGYGAAQFSGEATLRAAPFSRTNAANPFKDMSFAFVPYCTGDVHAGDAVQSYVSTTPNVPNRTVHHKGGHNMDAFLPRLKDTFPDARRVFISGSSAGAFGAQLNYERVVAMWPDAEVHLLADCGQMVNPNGTLLTEWLAAWNLTLPSDCPGCAADFTKFPTYLFTKYPTRRFGLLAYTQDGTLRQFFGYDATTFQAQTLALLAADYDPKPNAKYFLVADQAHVMLGNLFTLQANGTTLLDWTRRFVVADPAWATSKP